MEQDETVCGRCANSKIVVHYTTDTTEVDIGDDIPLIRRQHLIASGASNLMVHWVSHVTKLLLSGLITSAVLTVVLIVYIVAVKRADAYPSQKNIFFVDLQEKVTPQRLCATESLVRRHSDVSCYFYLTSDPIPTLTLLSDTYPNFFVRKWNWIMNIRETPMEPWIDHLDHLGALLYNSSKDTLEMIARLLFLWKYGGTSTSIDGKRNSECYWLMGMDRNGYHNIVDETDGGFIKFDPCHVLMERVIVEVMLTIESGKNINSTKLLSGQLQQLCQDPKIDNNKWKNCMGITVLGPSSVYPMKPSDTHVISALCPRVKSFSGFRIEKRDTYKKYEF